VAAGNQRGLGAIVRPGIKIALWCAWRYLLIAPPVLFLLSLLETAYLQILLPEMALIRLGEIHWLILGGLLFSYVNNGAWCAAFGAACSALLRSSAPLKSRMAFSGIAMGCAVTGFDAIQGLYADVSLASFFDPQYIVLAFLIFVKGAVAGAAGAHFSFDRIHVPDTADTFS
jgi:hypothetical protein